MTALVRTGSELIIGPWAHGGFLNNDQPGSKGKPEAVRSKFDSKRLLLDFLHALHLKPDVQGDSGQLVQQLAARTAQQASETIGPQPVQDAGDRHGSASASSTGNGESGSDAARAGPDAQSAARPAVHYFVMGHKGHWASCNCWPPPDVTGQHRLFLGPAAGAAGTTEQPAGSGDALVFDDDAAQHAMLQAAAPAQHCRWQHTVSRQKHFKVWRNCPQTQPSCHWLARMVLCADALLTYRAKGSAC